MLKIGTVVAKGFFWLCLVVGAAFVGKDIGEHLGDYIFEGLIEPAVMASKPLTHAQATTPCPDGERATDSPYGPSQASWEALLENQEAMLLAMQAELLAEYETHNLLRSLSSAHGQEME